MSQKYSNNEKKNHQLHFSLIYTADTMSDKAHSEPPRSLFIISPLRYFCIVLIHEPINPPRSLLVNQQPLPGKGFSKILSINTLSTNRSTSKKQFAHDWYVY